MFDKQKILSIAVVPNLRGPDPHRRSGSCTVLIFKPHLTRPCNLQYCTLPAARTYSHCFYKLIWSIHTRSATRPDQKPHKWINQLVNLLLFNHMVYFRAFQERWQFVYSDACTDHIWSQSKNRLLRKLYQLLLCCMLQSGCIWVS